MLGKILSYILIYSYYIWFCTLVILVLTVLVESFLCPHFRIEGLPLWVAFGFGSHIMCGAEEAFSGFVLNISILATLFIIFYSLCLIFINKVFKLGILEGEYKIKIDPVTKLIFKQVFKSLRKK